MNFGKNLRAIRYEFLCLSLPEFEKMTGVKKSAVSDYEKGNVIPDFKTILQLSSKLNVSTDLLLSDTIPDLKSFVHDRMIVQLRKGMMQFEGSEKYMRQMIDLIYANIGWTTLGIGQSTVVTVVKTKFIDN
jgi:transcriptional regulator with XRE-family HTH domain